MVLTMPVVVQDSEEASLQAQDAASHTCLMDDEEGSQLYGFSCCMDESSRDRMAEATDFLQPLNSILEGADSNLSPELVPTQGDDYCFFYVAAGVCSMEVSQTAARQVFACALEASCSEPDAKNAFGDTPEERKQRVAELLQHEEYSSQLMHRSSFELAIMDKFEFGNENASLW